MGSLRIYLVYFSVEHRVLFTTVWEVFLFWAEIRGDRLPGVACRVPLTAWPARLRVLAHDCCGSTISRSVAFFFLIRA